MVFGHCQLVRHSGKSIIMPPPPTLQAMHMCVTQAMRCRVDLTVGNDGNLRGHCSATSLDRPLLIVIVEGIVDREAKRGHLH